MKRYFYTDPLIAAYMIKAFGVHLSAADGRIILFDTTGGYGPTLEARLSAWNGGKSMLHPELCYDTQQRAYLHPDSLPLLEPKEGDVIGDDGGFAERVFLDDGKPMAGDWGIEELENPRVIERGGKPFFWPESEVAYVR